jgi:hypothetical protein
MQKLIAPCGIDCSICEAYTATQNDDMEMRQKLADKYFKQFNKTIDPASISCDACSQEGRHIGFCDQCEIRSCAFGRGFATCAECVDFPCEKGSFIWTNNSQSLANLEKLR